MQKRTFKFNILDLVIFVVVICSVAVLVFRGTINEAFEETSLATLEVRVAVNGEVSVSKSLEAMSKVVVFEPETNKETAFEVNVVEVDILPGSITVPNKAEVTVVCVGYEKLGRYYTENGERIYNNTQCSFVIDGERIEGNVISITEKGI